jgi:hypothetical protein
VAPPKRKTGGRTTPKGTKAGMLPTAPKTLTGSSGSSSGISSSSRYTPPGSQQQLHSMEESSTLFKIMMLALFVIGAALILTRYLFDTPQWMVFAGLGFIMGGLYAATKWR